MVGVVAAARGQVLGAAGGRVGAAAGARCQRVLKGAYRRLCLLLLSHWPPVAVVTVDALLRAAGTALGDITMGI